MRWSTQAHPLSRYVVAIVLVALALFLRWLFMPLLGSSTPFILLAVAVSAWHGGLGPGLTATFLSCLFLSIFRSMMIQPAGLNPQPYLPLLISILIMGSLLSALIESLRCAQSKAEMNAARLAESNERFQLLVNSANDYGIFMLDTEGRVLSWNEGAHHITGYEAEEIIGQHFSRFYPAEDIAAKKPQLELRLATETGRFEEESWRLRKDGSRFWASVIIAAVRDDQGQLRGFSKVTRDMTEKRKAEERDRLLIREQAAREQAENANKAKDQFLAVLSHELRTPINTIVGWAYLLKNGLLDEPTMREACESIERSSKLQMRLIEDLLDVSRMLAEKLSIESTPVELGAIVAAAVSAARFSFQEKSLELTVQGCPPPLWVSGDAVRLEQVISNLLNNAIKFTPAGGRIAVQLSGENGQAQIKISDSGVGISASAMPHIFEHFRQADSSATRQRGGLGLGLSIVHHVVEAHGGSVVAQSPGEGQGATLIVGLPLLDQLKPDATPAKPEA